MEIVIPMVITKVPLKATLTRKNTVSQQGSINPRLEWFIEALPHIEPIHYDFCLGKDVAFVYVRIVLHPGGKHSNLILIKSSVKILFTLPMAFYNILKQSQMNITNQLLFTFENCLPPFYL